MTYASRLRRLFFVHPVVRVIGDLQRRNQSVHLFNTTQKLLTTGYIYLDFQGHQAPHWHLSKGQNILTNVN